MADICCGVVSESEAAAGCERKSREARQRRLEIRRFRLVSDDVEAEMKRQKMETPSQTSSLFHWECANAMDRHDSCVSEDSEEHGKMKKSSSEAEEAVTIYQSSLLAVEALVPSLSSTTLLAVPRFGVSSVCGRRRDMEDAVAVHPSFFRRESGSVTGVHYFAVYDGHGCSHVAMRCRDRLHELVKEELEAAAESAAVWTDSLERSFNRMDKEVVASNEGVIGTCRCELQTPECDAVGSTAVTAIVTPDKIIVANCGDSRAVLCCNGKAVPLSVDHKPDRPNVQPLWYSWCLQNHLRGVSGIAGVQAKMVGDLAMHKPSIWYSWCLQNHLRGESVWEIEPKVDDTWVWKSILCTRNELRDALQVISPSTPSLQPVLNFNGGVSCSKVYEILREKGEPTAWGSFIWKRLQCRKWAFIVWLAARNRLQTGDRVKHWKGAESAVCAFCNQEEETSGHLWFDCHAIHEVLMRVMRWTGCGCRFGSIGAWLQWFAEEPEPHQKTMHFQPDRPDELNRIEEAGGRVIYWDCPRVLGVLAMSRAIGDNYLKPYVIAKPEVTITERTGDEEFLILASDGLWDVVTNDTACGVASMCLKGKVPASAAAGEGEASGVASDKACSGASVLLTKLALARHSADNVSVVVVDLRKDT